MGGDPVTAQLGAAGHGPVSACRWCHRQVTGANGIIVHVASGEALSLDPFRHWATTETQVQFARAVRNADGVAL